MTYRAELCAFCDESASESCPRCQVLVCAGHGLAGHRFCAMCRKERDEELELIAFADRVHEEAGGPGTSPQSRAIESMIGDLGRALHDFFAPPPHAPSFDTRTPAEIAEWRKAANIKYRG